MKKDKQAGSTLFTFRCSFAKDADVIAVLEAEDNPSAYVRQAIREKIANDEKAYHEFMKKEILD